MKIVVAGTGSIGERHIRKLATVVPDAQFIVLRPSGRRDDLVDRLGARVVTTLNEAMRCEPDALVVATPSALHIQLLLEAIVAGLPIYVEKPVVTLRRDLENLQDMLAKCSYKAPSLVGCNLRFLPSLKQMRQMVQDGVAGRIARAALYAGQWLPDWRPNRDYRKSYSSDVKLGGGVVFDLIHEIDAARWFFGEFETVIGMTATYEPLSIRSEAVAAIILAPAAGLPLVTVGLDYIARRPIRRYEIVGDIGTLVWDLSGNKLLVDDARERRAIDCGPDGFNVEKTYERAIAEFMVAIQTGGKTSQDIREGIRSAELAIRVKEVACPR